MMKKYILITLFFSFIIQLQAQSTDQFIRIVGNAKKEIKAEKAKVYFTIREVLANKYQNTEAQSMDQVYASFISGLQNVGVKESNLQRQFEKFNNYSKQKLKEFALVTDLETLDKITQLQIDGVSILKAIYLAPEMNTDIETELSLAAINDAKRKAKNICKKAGLTCGKILNIELKPSSGDFFKTEMKQSTQEKKYKVTVTFTLEN